ncbi:hypothetical protein BS78_02G006100 [Paspalum vaginatum]|nr:hypothetical protein BS78_02G006100 [Paspalum vaginatum]
MDDSVGPGMKHAVSRHHRNLHPQIDRSLVRGRSGGVRRWLRCRGRRHHLLHRVQLLAPIPGHGRYGHRGRQPRGPSVRAHLPAGAGAVALLRRHTQQGGDAALLRGAGQVGGAGALRATGGGHAACRRGVPPRHSHGIFDLDCCDEFGEKHCGFPRLDKWKKEMLWSAFASLRDNRESFRDDDDYHDS